MHQVAVFVLEEFLNAFDSLVVEIRILWYFLRQLEVELEDLLLFGVNLDDEVVGEELALGQVLV